MRFWIVALCLCLVGCGGRGDFAPVTELHWHNNQTQDLYHRVRPGETLYAVAFRYDQDYQQLARYNHLRPPYAIRVGQVLRLVPTVHFSSRRSTSSIKAGSLRVRSKDGFIWPIRGRILTGFMPAQGKKGIDIVSTPGVKVKAAAAGVIAYAGGGLAGYGNLLIIKHDNQFMTAYGNNSKYFVKEGQRVKSGQVIGEVGHLDRTSWGLHFEIRRAGKPVNPLIYLRNR